MNKNTVINITISLIKSNLTNEEMKSGYIDFLHRYLHQSNLIHEDEICLIRQEANRLNLDYIDYREDQVKYLFEYLKVHNEKKESNYNNTRQKKSSINNGSVREKTEIARLNNIIHDLKQKGKQAVASRDKWRRRAEVSEKLQQEKKRSNDKKFKKVKIMFSKMYHPDSLSGEKFEKIIKQEIFKEFWQVIESIEKNNV